MKVRSALLCLALVPLASAAKSPDQDGVVPQRIPETIGLVLTDVRYALYQTPDGKEECPAGLQSGAVDQFKAMPNFRAHLQKFGGTFENRGPNGELPTYSPLTVNDPLPWKEVATKKGYGFNLDGTPDGQATAKTCRHEKLTGPDGEAIDNQMARVLGCVQAWRKSGFSSDFYSKEVETAPMNRVLIEITGVDSDVNDPSVEVMIYKGRDRIVRSADGASFVPNVSHRIDARFPRYMSRTRGRIVDGVLITDPIPLARMPMIHINMPNERHLQDMRLRLKLTAEGAKGLMGGYEKLSTWWNFQSKSPASDIGKYSPALLYKAALRNADGYPDPATGQCTALSVAYEVDAVKVLIAHSPEISAGTGDRQRLR